MKGGFHQPENHREAQAAPTGMTLPVDYVQVSRGGKYPEAVVELDFKDGFLPLAVQWVEGVEGLTIARLSFPSRVATA